MELLQIAEKMREQFPGEVRDVKEFRGQISVTVGKARILEICRFLHDDPDLSFDYLVDLCGADWLGKKENRFEVVYHLYSIKHRHAARIKAEVPENDTRINSVMPVWIGANWHERECFDLYGIVFAGHPDLRRILLPEDWKGFPLRKDYPLKGPEEEWRGFEEVLERSKSFQRFEWQG